jgi:hypothetical protein
MTKRSHAIASDPFEISNFEISDEQKPEPQMPQIQTDNHFRIRVSSVANNPF